MVESGRADALFKEMLDAQASKSLPPVEKWHPEQRGRIDIRIARDGTWFHEGSEIKRAAMVKLFSTILRRDDGDYFLVTPGEQLAIEVEDVPFAAISLLRSGSGAAQQLLFTTNVDEHVLADAEHAIEVRDRDGEPAPYLHVRSDLWALMTRNVFYELVAMAEPHPNDPSRLGVTSCGEWFELGRV
ncbi:MAG: DUF1285 domain-containing protein [Gammaproteobacteria bacterium]|nr:DUF1285 domain-containing protein [Gammaproteobacteria bacterium]